jgi:outer membrane murein-binding lipoprotein Lpp
MRPWILPFVAGATAVALIATSVGLVVQHRRADAAEARAEQLAAEVEQLQARVAQLESGTGGTADGLGGLLDGLLGGGEGGIGDLLGGLLGGMGDLGSLLGSDGTPGAACLVPGGGGLGGLGDLGGLLGGDGGLGGLLGGDGGLGDLGGLLGGAGDESGDAADRPELPDDPDALVEALVPQVAEDRELAWTDPVEVDFLTTPELHARLDELLTEDADPALDDAYERLLVGLGAMPAGTDLATVRRQLLDDQVAGFYSPDTGELVVRVPDDGEVGTLDTITLAHELQHALADQALGLPDLEALEGSDRILAAQAVVEGDATLFMNQWALANIPVEDQIAAATGEDAARAQAGLDQVPLYLQRELLFPYTAGLDWVCDQWLDGGWHAVDAAYASPPTTTAEILYGADANDTVALRALSAPNGFEELHTDEFGAAPLLWLFEAPGGDETAALPDPRASASAWAGGEVTIWGDGDDTAVGLVLGDAAGTLCDDMADWYRAAFPGARVDGSGGSRTFTGSAQSAAMTCDRDMVRVAIAPTAEVARTVVGG